MTRCFAGYVFLVFLALYLAGVTAQAAAQTVRGVLMVSMTVLPSCEVRANGKMTDNAATVFCPDAYPFRASLSRGVTIGVVSVDGDQGRVFTGVQQVRLPWLSVTTKSGAAHAGVVSLTVSY
jgi:hypothetical protein